MRNIFKIVLLLSLAACSSRKGGGGSGGGDTSDEQKINAAAAEAYAKVKAESKPSTNAQWTAMVERVSKRIAAASGEPFQWEVMLIENPEPNAWCMPGGKMAVYTGIMPILENEAALAAVMGHEVAHATLRHGKDRYARSVRGSLIGLGLGVGALVAGQLICKTQLCKAGFAAGGAVGAITVTFFDRKFSREDETSADKEGQLFMARAGYDPSEASKVWERMEKASGGKGPPEWTSTHPKNERRRNNLQNWLPEAQVEYQKAPSKLGLGARI